MQGEDMVAIPGAIHSKAELCPMNKPPAFSTTQEESKRFHLKGEQKVSAEELHYPEMVMSGLHAYFM